MKFSFFIKSILLLFVSTYVYANSCEDIEIGAMGKSHWGTSITDGLKGELVNQITKNDDLYDKISPEIQVDLLSDVLEGTLQIGRQIHSNLPIPLSGRVSTDDLFSYKINDELLLELKAKVDGEFVFAEGTAGTQLLVSSDYLPGQKNSGCEVFKRILDKNTKEGRAAAISACEYKDKNIVTKYYEKAVNFFSKYLGKVFKSVSDSEEKLLYAEDVLSGLKVHSRLGLPIDDEVFYASNGDLSIGDIVEHTTYYGVKPIGVQVPLVSGVTPRYYRYKRVFRTTAFKKLYGNKVLVEIEDNILKGNQFELYRLRPRILSIIKLNFGSGLISNFDKESLLQRFEVDLNKIEGRKFLKLLISSLYKPSIHLNFDSVLIDSSMYARAVKAHEPIFKAGSGVDKNFNYRFFSLFGGSYRDFSQAEKIKSSDQEYPGSEKYLQDKFFNKISLNLGLFEISKADRNYECRLKLRRNNSTNIRDDMAMFSECTFKNDYSTNQIKDELANFINLSLNGEMSNQDRTLFNRLNFTKKDKLNAYLKLSFNKEHIDRIVNASDDEIYSHLSELFFGEGTRNLFAPRYHKLWETLKPKHGPKASISQKLRTMSPKFRNCSTALDLIGITDPIRESIVAAGMASAASFDGNMNRCYQYYVVAKEIIEVFESLREGVNEQNSYDRLVNIGFDLDRIGLVQALLVRLSGGIKQAKVHYTYIVTTPQMSSVIGRANGSDYTIGENGLDKELTAQKIPDYFPRVDHVRFTINTCDPSIVWGHFKLKYMIEDRSKVYATFDLRNFSTFADEEVGIVRVSMADAIKDAQGEYHVPLYFEEGLDLTEAHNVFFSLQNSETLRLSNEYKVYLQKYIAEEDEEEAN